MYASGAGLGASKGKEVGKYQDGYGGYLQMAKDVVCSISSLCRNMANAITLRPGNATETNLTSEIF